MLKMDYKILHEKNKCHGHETTTTKLEFLNAKKQIKKE
jgi:hypothetical protein